MLDIFDESGKKTPVNYEPGDNAVAIKRKLCDIIYTNEIQLQLLSDGDLLDNNRYLPDGTARLDYRIIKGDSSDVIIKVARNKYKIPKLIQIDKRHSIGQLESVLTSFSDVVDRLAIFSESGERLETRSTVEQSGLVNDCKIRVCHQKDVTLSLSVTNILPVQATFSILCGILDTVAEVKERICSNLHVPITDQMAIFSESEFLETDRQLIDYSIGDGDLIFYVDLLKKNEIELGSCVKAGQFAVLQHGKNLTTNTDIVVKKYVLKEGDKLPNFKPLKYEIITFLQLRSEEHPRFVKLDSMFEDKSWFYIAMEYMKGGSLDALLPLNKYFNDPESTIINFSIQILEGLAFLHKKRILYRSMNCSSVLLDETCTTVKLGSFHLSKFMQGENAVNLLEGLQGSTVHTYNWAPPEMLLHRPYGVKADMWSFGATLVEMVTGGPPYVDLNPPQIKDKISVLKHIEYTEPDWMSGDLKDAIEMCLKPDPQDRPTAKEMKKMFMTMRNQRIDRNEYDISHNKLC